MEMMRFVLTWLDARCYRLCWCSINPKPFLWELWSALLSIRCINFKAFFPRSESRREMTLVLSMNPFLDPEGDPPLSPYQPLWETECCTKSCLSNSAPPSGSGEQFKQGTEPTQAFIHSFIQSLIHLTRSCSTDCTTVQFCAGCDCILQYYLKVNHLKSFSIRCY